MRNSDLYERRIVAFIDILGFKEMVRSAEKNLRKFERLYEAVSELKSYESFDKWRHDLIEIEEDAQKKGPEKFRLNNRLNTTAFSDSVVISVKVEDDNVNEMTTALICNLAHIGNDLIKKGILIRGGITIGNILHDENGTVLGQGLIDAYNLENSLATYPRIILSDILIKKLNYPGKTKRNRYPYHQYLQRYKDGCVGFHQLIYNQVMNSWSNYSDKEQKKDLKKIRNVIVKGLDFSFESPGITNKYQWLKEQYNKLIIFDNDINKSGYLLEKIIEHDNVNVDAGQNIYYSYAEDVYTKNKWGRDS